MAPGETSDPRVVHLISSLQVGGAERLLVDFMVALKPQQRDRVTVVIMNESDAALLAELKASGVSVVTMERKRGSRNPRYLLQLLEIVGHGTVVIHAHNRGSKLWAMLARAVRPKSRLVFTVHALNVANAYGAFHKRLHNRLIDRTVAISRAVARECTQSGLANVSVVRNGVNISRFESPNPPAACRLERHPDRVPVIVTVARLIHRIKGQDVLIEAAALLKARGIKTRVRLVGSASRDQPESPQVLRDLVERHGLQDTVAFIGGVSDAAPVYRDADICVVPSREEGFGLVIVEAMASGVPVVASRLDGPSELVVPGLTGDLAETANAEDLADKIEALIRDPSRASRMVRDARAVARAHDIAVMRDAYFDLYRSIAR